MRALVVAATFVAVLGLAPTPAGTTDLGEGNEALAKRYEAYVAGGHRSKPRPDAQRRVMVTGFGLFSGVDFNISGVVAESMAAADFWPRETKLGAEAVVPPAEKVRSGKLGDKDHGARVFQRTLVIDGEPYTVCFLVLDVLWDLGAAITLYEADHFQPHLIVMTGRGGPNAVFEAGSLNQAARYPGFRPDGAADGTNVPSRGVVLDPKGEGIEAAIAMRWDNRALAAAARPVVRAIDASYRVVAAPGARPGNTYICNNIACAVLHGVKCGAVELAGGKIVLKDLDLDGVTAGFFHYPAAATNAPAEVHGWATMLATVIKTHFAANEPAAAAASND